MEPKKCHKNDYALYLGTNWGLFKSDLITFRLHFEVSISIFHPFSCTFHSFYYKWDFNWKPYLMCIKVFFMYIENKSNGLLNNYM